MLTSLQNAKRKGCKIISVNPMPETGLLRFKHPQEVSGVLGNGTALTDLFCKFASTATSRFSKAL
jgi:hypothetical protein